MENKFDIKIESSTYPRGHFNLLTTHNGLQWSGMTLSREELEKVSLEIQEFLSPQMTSSCEMWIDEKQNVTKIIRTHENKEE